MQSPKKKSARAIPVGRQTRRASSELRKLICQPMTEPLRRRSTAKSEKNQKFKLFVLKFNSFQGCRWMLLMSLSDKPYHLVRRRKICGFEKSRGLLGSPLFSWPVEVFYDFFTYWPGCVSSFSTPNFFKIYSDDDQPRSVACRVWLMLVMAIQVWQLMWYVFQLHLFWIDFMIIRPKHDVKIFS